MVDPGQPFITGPSGIPRPQPAPSGQAAIESAKQILGILQAIYDKVAALEGRVAGFEIMMSKMIEEIESQGDAIMTFNDAIIKVSEKAKQTGQSASFADFLQAVEDVYRQGAAEPGFTVPSGVDHGQQDGGGFQVPSGVEIPVVPVQ